MQTQTKYRAIPQILPRPNCLGCTDCLGLCRDLFDLTSVPDAVLHRSDTQT